MTPLRNHLAPLWYMTGFQEYCSQNRSDNAFTCVCLPIWRPGAWFKNTNLIVAREVPLGKKFGSPVSLVKRGVNSKFYLLLDMRKYSFICKLIIVGGATQLSCTECTGNSFRIHLDHMNFSIIWRPQFGLSAFVCGPHSTVEKRNMLPKCLQIGFHLPQGSGWT